MLLYQRCIVTKLFKKKKNNTKQNLGLYYRYILSYWLSALYLKEDSYILGR